MLPRETQNYMETVWFFFSLSIKSIFKYVQSTPFIADTVGP